MYSDGDIVQYHDSSGRFIKKERYIVRWHDDPPFEYSKQPLNYYREYIGGNMRLFHGFYDIRQIEIEPLGQRESPDKGPDTIELRANDMSYHLLDQRVINFDDPATSTEQMGVMGILLEKYPAHHFLEYGLYGGLYNGYRVTIVEERPAGVICG